MPRPKRHNPSGYRSGLEVKFQAACAAKGWTLGYEQDKIKYVIPANNHTYTPDFTVTKNVYIETKGLWTGADRKKAVLLKQQHPDISILYVFQRNQGLSKKSTTTYLDWAAKNGLEACVFSDTTHWTEYILKHI
jgi:predicted nuclease of restriction endonuclease-like RecB superfamily